MLPDMTYTSLLHVATGHCGLCRRHMDHRFWDPVTQEVYACPGWPVVPVGFVGVRRDPAHTPQARHAVEAPLYLDCRDDEGEPLELD
jgi:hypothetical protein